VDFAFLTAIFPTTILKGGFSTMKVEFYYDSTVAPVAAFPCDNAKVVGLIDQLAAKGTSAKAIDLKGEQVAFMTYNSALTGPKAQVRAVFGAKGALQEDFGKTVPALLVFEKDADRYPVEAFPRSDKELQKTLGCEEAAQRLLEKA
jgi:hypothetical protein